MSKTKKHTPKHRFPKFKNDKEWEEKILGELAEITNGKANAQDHIENGIYPLFDRSEVIKSSNTYIFDCETVIIPGEGMRFIPKYYEGKFNLHQRAYALKNFSCNGKFVYYSILNNTNLLSQKAVQSTVLSLRLPILQNFPCILPPTIEEQQKIADCLSSVDELIALHEQKLELLKAHKKGLLQQLFPDDKRDENVVGGGKLLIYNYLLKLRFPEFKNDKPWEVKTLGEVLDYKRPDNYIVKDTNYQTNGIPVLTANKSFILGYTNEEFGVFDNFPVIIFDDFTTDSKFVDFPFKVKSSAIKILLAKNNYNIKFIYELISTIKFEATEHKRYYISEYQNIKLPFPSIAEQQKIAACLSSVDIVISTQTQKIETLKNHKKGLLQNLLVNENNVA
ncbi:restriction endonuclease subunit S [Capnocytophaga catalasegens]|nr:restriction endonuclease subunit S [Capnocytophaga catalasegens]